MLVESPMITTSTFSNIPTNTTADNMYDACITASSAQRLCFACNRLKRNGDFTTAKESRFFGNCDACVHNMKKIWTSKRNPGEDHVTKDSRHTGLMPQRMNMQKLRANMTYLKKRLQKKTTKYNTNRLEALCGCDAFHLKAHIESMMKDGMSWDNLDKWYITFKRPCKSFNLTDEHEFLECAHYTNLDLSWNKKQKIRS